MDLNPHQVDGALFAFNSSFSNGALLADEVGLGKTIEAGILLSQRWAERERRILIITPSNLRKQWHQELAEKFFLPATIFTESRRTQDYLLRLRSESEWSEGIVLFNGTNNDERSKEIYEAWKVRHAGSDRVTGSRTADMRFGARWGGPRRWCARRFVCGGFHRDSCRCGIRGEGALGKAARCLQVQAEGGMRAAAAGLGAESFR